MDTILKYLRENVKASAYIHDEKIYQKKVTGESIRKKVEIGLKMCSNDLNERRDKLRKLLLLDETEMMRELIECTRKIEEQRVERIKAVSIMAKEEAESKRLQFLSNKLLHRVFLENQEMKKYRRQAYLEDTKRINIIQIAEIEQKQRYEKNLECCWFELWQKNLEYECIKELETARNRSINIKAIQQVLLHQQLDKVRRRQQLREEEHQSDEGLGSKLLAQSEYRNFIRKEKAKLVHEALKVQLEENRRRQDIRQQFEENENSMGINLPTSGNNKVDRDNYRRELHAYMKSSEEIRKVITKQEVDLERHTYDLAS